MNKEDIIANGMGVDRTIKGLVSDVSNSYASFYKSSKIREELRARKGYLEFSIRQSVCPECNGKLYRGKRNKKNDYKRSFVCGDCFMIYEI